MHATGRPLAFDAVLLIGSASSHAVAYRLIGLFLRSPSNSLNCLVASCIKFNALQLIRSTPSPGPGQSAARLGRSTAAHPSVGGRFLAPRNGRCSRRRLFLHGARSWLPETETASGPLPGWCA